MLTSNTRPYMFQRAARCWARQTYPKTELYVHVNDGTQPLCHLINEGFGAALRKYPNAEYLAKFDDDDMSDPRRLAEQMARLRSSDALVTGYFNMPMLDADTGEVSMYNNPTPTYALGTSLFFHRDAWLQKLFPDTTARTARGTGSDSQWVTYWAGEGKMLGVGCIGEDGVPRMIATLHGDNTAPAMQRKVFGLVTTPFADKVRQIASRM